jgi:hypothetical protein
MMYFQRTAQDTIWVFTPGNPGGMTRFSYSWSQPLVRSRYSCFDGLPEEVRGTFLDKAMSWRRREYSSWWGFR